MAQSASSRDAGKQRLQSIDALRGFDMFWIIRGDALFRAIAIWLGYPALARQMQHVEWDGFRFYDLIFPLFLFIVGVVLPFSLSKYSGAGADQSNRAAVYRRIFQRAVLLVLLGFVYSNFLQFNFAEFRWPGVLQRIGLCYLAAALIVLNLSVRTQTLLVAALLAGYWALLRFVPAPGHAPFDLTMEGNLAGYLDRLMIPGRLYYGYGDNEGILSTFPALCNTLLGALAGHWLMTARAPVVKALGLAIAAAGCLAGGYAWSAEFPLNKILWTSSFVLVTAGWSLALLALFYLLIDVAGFRRWAFFFTVIGMNPITIYVMQQFVDFEKISRFFLGGVMQLTAQYDPAAEKVVLFAGILAAKWLILLYLYRNRTFLRV
jgi:predicted acyltransferase